MASSYRGNGPQSALNTQFRGAALAITGLLKAAQAQSQDGERFRYRVSSVELADLLAPAYRQGYNDALQDALEALQNGLAVHQDGDASMGIPALIDWIEVSFNWLRLLSNLFLKRY